MQKSAILNEYNTRPAAEAAARWSSSLRLIIPASKAVRTSTLRARKPKTSDLRIASSSRYRLSWLIALRAFCQLPFPMRRRRFFLGDVGLNLFPVRVIVSQGGVHLGKIQMGIFESNFLWRHAHLVPAYDSPYGQSRAGDLRPAAPYSWITPNQGTDFHARCHGFSLPLLG